jgi:hypothetical protein
MAEAVADLIRTDPSLIRRAFQQTHRASHEGQGTADSDIGEWRQLLETYSAERLRRSAPFFAVLTAEERDRIMKELETKR